MRLTPLWLALIFLACGSHPPADRPQDNDGGAGGSGGTTPCVDVDRDGFSASDCGGPDCADLDPAIHPGASEICGDDGDQDCDGDPDSGCTCTPGDMRACWGGGAGERGVGQCRDGAERCGLDGVWTACVGEIGAANDLTCDGFDEDCNPDKPVCKCPGDVEICGNGLDDDCNGVRDDPDFCTWSCRSPTGAPLQPELWCCTDPEKLRYATLCVEAAGLPPCDVRPCLDLDGDPGTACVYETPCNRLGCELRTHQPCYSGRPGTLGVGVCRGGFATCVAIGDAPAWSGCGGEVLPGAEVCGNGLDDDCDGRIDEEVGTTSKPCPADRPCGEEVCGNGLDDDCDGFADEACPAERNRQACWTGPPALRGVGACRDGTQAGEDGWLLPCAGQTLPAPEVCGDEIDADCNGAGGPFQEEDAACCVASGEETCNGQDDDCDGLADEGLLSSCGTCGLCQDTLVLDRPGDCSEEGRSCDRILSDGIGSASVDVSAPLERCDAGILIYDSSNNVVRVDIQDATATWKAYAGFDTVGMGCDGSVWLTGSSERLRRLDAQGVKRCELFMPGNHLLALAVDEHGVVWGFRFENQEMVLQAAQDDGTSTCRIIDLQPDDPSWMGIPMEQGVVLAAPRDQLWILRSPKGVARFDTRDHTLLEIPDLQGLQGAAVDDAGNLWLANDGDGETTTRVRARGTVDPGSWPRLVQYPRYAGGLLWGVTYGALPPAVGTLDLATGQLDRLGAPVGYLTTRDPVPDVEGGVWAEAHAEGGGSALARWHPRSGWTVHEDLEHQDGEATNWLLRSAAALQSFGKHRASWTQDLDGRGSTLAWKAVRWNADVPEGAAVTLTARFAGTLEELADAPPCPLGSSPASLDGCPGAEGSRFVRLEARLMNGWDAAPRLLKVQVDRTIR